MQFHIELLTRYGKIARALLEQIGSSKRKHVGDAWAHGGDEGRGKLRKVRGSGTHAVIPKLPNGETRRAVRSVTPKGEQTLGTETSQYRQEEKSTEMPLVAASEKGGAQTEILVVSGL